ncbi:MAG: hypothetical protein KA184_16800 [Candidatus Hydrogenedentes bacterium]|nr:hypothetical protein [Candidatus Hydrogenedentota bacterium]
MEADAFWKAYVGERAPGDFLERRQGRSLRDFVDSYISQVPHFYGIVQRGTWRETFAATPHWRRDEVAVGLLTYLELHREEWEHLESAPQRASAPDETAAAPPAAPAQEAPAPLPSTAPAREAHDAAPVGTPAQDGAALQPQPAEPAASDEAEAPAEAPAPQPPDAPGVPPEP